MGQAKLGKPTNLLLLLFISPAQVRLRGRRAGGSGPDRQVQGEGPGVRLQGRSVTLFLRKFTAQKNPCFFALLLFTRITVIFRVYDQLEGEEELIFIYAQVWRKNTYKFWGKSTKKVTLLRKTV